MRLCAAAVSSAIAVLAVTAAPAAAQSPSTTGAVVVIGVPALRWDDVTESGTPVMWALAGQGSIGALAVRSAGPTAEGESAPTDGWATLSAGNRATGRLPSAGPLDIPRLPADMDVLRARNSRFPIEAEIGALGTALRAAGVTRVAFGPGAALALADDSGRVDEVGRSPDALSANDFIGRLGAGVQERAVVVVEMRQLLQETTAARLAEVDKLVGVVEKSLTPQDTLLIAGVSGRPGQESHLRVAMARGSAYPRGRLRSPSTRRDGFVQLIDLGPTVLRLKKIPAGEAMVGRPWMRAAADAASPGAEIARLVDADRAADGYRRYVPTFFLLLVLAQILLYGAAFAALRYGRPRADRRTMLLAAVRRFALVFGAVPVSTYLAHLIPWWRHPLMFLIAVVAVIAGLISLLAARGPWRGHLLGPEGFIAGTTFAVVAIDLLTGARLQLSSPAGYSPVVAGRFAGVGNVAFAVLATGALLLAAALSVGADARRRLVVVAAVGIAAVAIDGAPMWGSDFGGVLALVPAFAVLAVLLSGGRITWRVVFTTAFATAAVVAAFASLDYSRPAQSQTHLGRFLGQLLHGGAGAVVGRKATSNARLLIHSPLTLLVPFTIALVVALLLRPPSGLRRAFAAAPALRAGLISVLVMGVAGFAFNDSGVVVPVMAMTVAVPLALAATTRYATLPETSADAPDMVGDTRL